MSLSWLHRRAFLGRSAGGIGSLALASLLDPTLLRGATGRDTGRSSRSTGRWQGAVQPLHFPARIKRIIYLYMAGGPSHLETLDYKPALAKMQGQPMPESFTKGMPIAQLQGAKLVCLAPQHPFRALSGERSVIERDLSAPGHGRRRHLHHQLDGHRRDQPRPGSYVHEYGHDHLGPAGDGLVAHLWAGK